MKITENDGKFWIKSKEVEQVYHDLTIELMINTIKRLKQRGNADLLRNPYVWQLEKLNDMHLLTEENVQTIAKYSDISERLFRDVIANEGFKIYKHGHEQLAKALETTATINYGLQKSLDAMARQTMYETNNLINTSLPPALQKGFKRALEKAVGAVVGGISDEKKALTKAVFEMFDNGFTAFVDKGGRTWTAERYAKTVIRTTTFRTYRELKEEPAKELEIDTYYYSAKSSAREMCAPLQHRIVTKGVARTIKGERVLSLPDYGLGSPGGCLGINCGHYLTPFVIGVNYKPELPDHLKDLTEEEAKENALDKARFNAYEREIKKVRDKKQMAKALDNTELYDKLKLREKTLRASKKELIEKNPTVIGKAPIRDNPTLAGVRKGKAMTFEQANGMNANPKHGKDVGYSTNCQTCVVAFEARLRGYEVEALPNTKGSMLEKLTTNYRGAWYEKGTKIKPLYLPDERETPHTPASFKKHLVNTIKEGERYTMDFGWRGHGRTGHVIHIYKKDGNIQFYDPQIGESYKGKQVDDYLKLLRYKISIQGEQIPWHPNILRVDNLDFNKSVVDEILKVSDKNGRNTK